MEERSTKLVITSNSSGPTQRILHPEVRRKMTSTKTPTERERNRETENNLRDDIDSELAGGLKEVRVREKICERDTE
jgi:hypothetical protein